MTTEMVVRPESSFTVGHVKDRVRKVQDLMQHVLREGNPEKDKNWAQSDYAVIPGTGQKSLLKPGAEKLIMLFQMSPSFNVEDLGTELEARFRVTCSIQDREGFFLGAVTAEASSFESKSAWRKAICDEEWNEAPDVCRRNHYKSWNGKVETVKQIRTEKADQTHSTLMRAQKRALVGVVRMVTAASDIFTQDIEDDPSVVNGERAPIAKPQAKPAPTTTARHEPQEGEETIVTHVVGVSKKAAKNGGHVYWIETSEPNKYSTFSDTLGAQAADAQAKESTVRLTWKASGQYRNAVAIEEVGEAAE